MLRSMCIVWPVGPPGLVKQSPSRLVSVCCLVMNCMRVLRGTRRCLARLRWRLHPCGRPVVRVLLGLLWRAMAATVEPEEPGLVPSVARSELRRGVPQVAAIEAALKAYRPRVEPGVARAAARDISVSVGVDETLLAPTQVQAVEAPPADVLAAVLLRREGDCQGAA